MRQPHCSIARRIALSVAHRYTQYRFADVQGPPGFLYRPGGGIEKDLRTAGKIAVHFNFRIVVRALSYGAKFRFANHPTEAKTGYCVLPA